MSGGTAQLYADLRDFEIRHHSFERRIAGIPWWELVRYDVFRALSRERELWRAETGATERRPRPWCHAAERAVLRARQLLRAPAGRLPRRGAPLLLVGHARRKRLADGRWWDLTLDPVADECRRLGVEVDFAEGPHRERHHYSPAHTRERIWLDAHLARARLEPRRRAAPTAGESRELSELAAALRDGFGSELDLESAVRGALRRFDDDRALWRRLLGRLRPRALLFTAGTGREGMIAAARERGVVSVELQHGTPLPGKVNYDYDREDKPRRYFADYFLAYGAYWKRRNPWPIDPERVVPLGWPYFQEASGAFSGAAREPLWVFVSQPTVGERLARLAAQVAELAPSQTRLVFKLHPEERSAGRRYPELLGTRVETLGDGPVDLYELLSRAELQVGVYSTALYEGLALGCPTALLDAPGVEYMRDLVERGMAAVVPGAAELLRVRSELRVHPSWGAELFGEAWQPRFRDFLDGELGIACRG